MSPLMQRNPKINFFILSPFSDELLFWIKEEDKIAQIDVKYITDLAISLAMLYRFKDPTMLILEKFGLNEEQIRNDFH